MSIQALLLGALLALLYSLGMAGLVYRVAGERSAQRAADAIALGIGATPFLAGLVTIAAIAALGKSSDAAYVSLHFAFAGALMLSSAGSIVSIGYRLCTLARTRIREARALWRAVFRIETLLAAAALLQLAWLCYLVLAVPLIGNDSLEYAMVAKVLYARRAFGAYPLTEADPATGMYAPWTHPPMYVAQIFLAYMLQGTSELPGLMRLIALYCICAALFLLSRISIRAQPGAPGWKAALWTSIFVLSVPLIRFMIGEASIDALPILGLTLVFATASLFSQASPRTRIALTGVALGLSLWAHSSAVLFPVLAVVGISVMRWYERKPFAAECAGVLLVGGALGILPYLRNLLIFGSPISDTPAVFALAQLDWESYFTTGRGMSNLYDKIVVGVLRGWTAFPDFWLTFWFMTAGMVLVARQMLFRRAPEPGWAMLTAAAAIVVAFHAGMLLSALLGTTLMIKNARYLLPVVPLAALLAGFALSRIAAPRDMIKLHRTDRRITIALDFNHGQGGQLVWQFLVVGILYLSVQQIAISMVSWRNYLGPLRAALWQPQRETLAKFAFYRVQDHMRQNLPPEAVVLSLRPADAYYAKHRIISYLDPRMLPAYKETDPAKLSELLRQLGVTHVYKGNYSLPAIYNSALMQFLADRQLSRVIHSDGHYAVYVLNTASPERMQPSRTWDLAPDRYPWIGHSWAQVPFFVSSCRTENIRVDSAAPQPTVRSCPWAPAHRADYVSGTGPPGGINIKDFIEVQPGGMYRYKIDVAGEGALRILVYEKHGQALSVQQIDDAVLTKAPRIFTGMFQLPSEVTHIRLALSVEGAGELSIRDVRLEALETAAAASGVAPTSSDAGGPRMPAR